MAINGDQRINFFTRRILGATDLDNRFRTPLEEAAQRFGKALTTGGTTADDPGAFFETAVVQDGVGLNHLTFLDLFGTDGKGNIISAAAGSTYTTEVPFEDAGAATYHMAAKLDYVATKTDVNLTNGEPEYDYFTLRLGHREEPSAVAVVGGGTQLELTLGNHQLDGADDFTGRTCVIWKKTPDSDETAVAIEQIVIAGNIATTTGVLGQSTPSTTASDYFVTILGPVITRSSSVQSLGGYAYIGSVVGGGAPRTFDDAGQTVLLDAEEATAAFVDLLRKGWIERPTVAVVGSGYDITGAGEVFSNGSVGPTPLFTSPGPYATSSTFYVSWSPIDASFVEYTSWDDANAGNRVPLLVFTTDGVGDLDQFEFIAWHQKKFPETLRLSVSADPEHYGAFKTLEEALARAYSIQTGSTIGAKSIVIDVRSDLDVGGAIDQPFHFPVNVTIRAAHPNLGRTQYFGPLFGAGVLPDRLKGYNISWSGNHSLFRIQNGADMTGWAFIGLNFWPTGTFTLARSVVEVAATALSLTGVAFYGCGVVGTDFYQGGRLSHMIAINDHGSTAGKIVIDGCGIALNGAVIRAQGATQDVDDVRITNSEFSNSLQTTIDHGAPGGLINVEGDVENIHIKDNVYSSCNGTLLQCNGLKNFQLVGNNIAWIFGTINECAILSAGDGTEDVNGIFIRDNYGTISGPSPLREAIYLALPDTGAPGRDRVACFIHDNYFRGDGEATISHEFIQLECMTGDVEGGIYIHDNSLVDFIGGVRTDVDQPSGYYLRNLFVHDNDMSIGQYGVFLTDGCERYQVHNNVIDALDSGGACVQAGANSVGTYGVISNNVLLAAGSSERAINFNSALDTEAVVVSGNTFSGLIFQSGAGVLTDMVVASNVCLFDSEIVLDDANGIAVTGNVVGDIIFGSSIQDATLTGNVTAIMDLPFAAQTAVVGNQLYTTGVNGLQMGSAGGSDNVVVGNMVEHDVDIETSETVVGHNWIQDIVVSGDNALVDGNIYDGTISVTGTGATNTNNKNV